MKRIISVALVICAVSMTARAQSITDMSGNKLYKLCDQAAPTGGRNFCSGYMAGFRDGISLVHRGYAKAICIPFKVSTLQIMDVVSLALSKEPKTRHQHAEGLVYYALAKAWPCP